MGIAFREMNEKVKVMKLNMVENLIKEKINFCYKCEEKRKTNLPIFRISEFS